MMVWGGLRLVVTIFLRVAIILRYRGCGMWVLATFWDTLFQLAVSSLKWINRIIKDVGEKVDRMLNTEASRNRTVDGGDDQGEEETTIKGLSK
jgi:hypothetical protein